MFFLITYRIIYACNYIILLKILFNWSATNGYYLFFSVRRYIYFLFFFSLFYTDYASFITNVTIYNVRPFVEHNLLNYLLLDTYWYVRLNVNLYNNIRNIYVIDVLHSRDIYVIKVCDDVAWQDFNSKIYRKNDIKYIIFQSRYFSQLYIV